MSRVAKRLCARHLAVLLVLPLIVSGCASGEPDYYTLQPIPGQLVARGQMPGQTVPGPVPGPVPDIVNPVAPALIEIRRVTLAGYLDRAEIVRNAGSYQLDIASGARWAEPLGDMAARVLAADLTQRLARSTVFSGTGAITEHADARVEIDISRFDADSNGSLVLAAVVSVMRGMHQDTQAVIFRAPSADATMAARAAAMSACLGLLADHIAQRLVR